MNTPQDESDPDGDRSTIQSLVVSPAEKQMRTISWKRRPTAIPQVGLRPEEPDALDGSGRAGGGVKRNGPRQSTTVPASSHILRPPVTESCRPLPGYKPDSSETTSVSGGPRIHRGRVKTWRPAHQERQRSQQRKSHGRPPVTASEPDSVREDDRDQASHQQSAPRHAIQPASSRTAYPRGSTPGYRAGDARRHRLQPNI